MDENLNVSPHGSNTMLGVVQFSRELFVSMVEAIEAQHRHDEKCSRAFRILLPNDYVSNYDNHWLQNSLIHVLQIAMNDKHCHSWIEYYMWELDFGRKQTEEFCARTKKGLLIDLSNAGALYDYLIKKRK